MKSIRELETIGWIFWSILAVLLTPVGLWLSWQLTYDTANILLRVGLGLFMAAIGAGLLSWGLNEILYRRMMRKQSQQKKVARKEKRRKKKK